LEEIFNGFDIMIYRRLESFDPLCIRKVELVDDCRQESVTCGIQFRQLRYLRTSCQVLQPTNFDDDPKPNQSELTADCPQWFGMARVAAVYW